MRKILLLIALAMLCIGSACAERGVNPFFAQTRPIPVTTDSPEYFAKSSLLQVPDDIQTGEVFTITAAPGFSRYCFEVLKLIPEENMWDYDYFNGNGTEENTLDFTVFEPGSYQIRVTAYDAEGIDHKDKVEVSATGEDLLDQQVSRIVADCPKGEYEAALWLHDHLTFNAYYDENYTRYGPSGVLMLGYGVCDSYSKAYELLLRKVGIDSRRIISRTHAWNAVFLEGAWYNIDCTWDDPTSQDAPQKVSGYEGYDFFGLPNEILFKVEEHQPKSSGYPECVSYACNYYIRNDNMPWYPGVEQSVMDHMGNGETSFSIELSEWYPVGDGYLYPVVYPVINYGLCRHKLETLGFENRNRNVALSVDYDAESNPWTMSMTAHYTRSAGPRVTITADEIGEEAFMGTDAVVVEIDGNCRRIAPRCFADMPKLDEVKIPASVTEIAEDAFRGAPENLLVVTTPNSAAAQFALQKGYCLELE